MSQLAITLGIKPLAMPPGLVHTEYISGKPRSLIVEKLVGINPNMATIQNVNREAILEGFANGCTTKQQIIEVTKLSKACVRVNVKALVDMGYLSCVITPPNFYYYSLTGKPYVPTGNPCSHKVGEENRRLIREQLADGCKWSAQEMADEIGVSLLAARRHLKKMVEDGIVMMMEKNPRLPLSKTEYWLVEEA